MFDRILCPLDFSEQSLKMLDCLMELQHLGAKEMVICHVAPTSQAGLTAEQKAIMNRLTDDLGRAGVKVTEVVERGSPAEQVLKVAERENVNLIALASSGKGKAQELLIGSTSFGILRSTTRPVLVNKFEVGERGGRREIVPACRAVFRKALLPLDFSTCTDTCMELIPKLSRLGLQEAVLFNVIESSKASMDDDRRFKKVLDTVQAKLEVLMSKLEEQGCNVSTHVHFGTVSYNILEATRELEATVIILGAHRKSLLREIALGGNSEAVVRKSEVPVLIIPCER
jgi:nucleotide-binding universal stress UspA family protein